MLREITAIVQSLRDGQVKPRRNFRLFGELAIDTGRGFLDGVKKSLGGLAALKRIAAAEQIVGQELIHCSGDGSFMCGVIALAGQTQREEHNQSDNRSDGRTSQR